MLTEESIFSNNKNTLSEIITKLREKNLSKDEFGSVNMFHRSFMMTFTFLPEIWSRILQDARLDIEYWKVYVDLYDPGVEEREPTSNELEIMKKWRKHRFRLNLDIEDWFIHSYILMDKFAKFSRRLQQLLANTEKDFKLTSYIPTKNFDKHRKFFLKEKNYELIPDIEYAKIISEKTNWYEKKLKNIRDDLIQHELVPRFWGYGVYGDRIRLSRFRHSPKLLEIFYGLREKYSILYPEIYDEKNFFSLMVFFESHLDILDDDDIEKVKRVRQLYGARFPDIPLLFRQMSDFFSAINDHYIGKI